MMGLYNKVKLFRTQEMVKQDLVAKYSGVGRSTLSEIENNKHIPRVDTAIRIARALGRTVEEVWILEGE